MIDERRPHAANDEPPPILGSWQNLYVGVILVLVLIIIAVYALSRHFS